MSNNNEKKWYRVSWVEKHTFEFPHLVLAYDEDDAVDQVAMDSRSCTVEPEVETTESFAREENPKEENK